MSSERRGTGAGNRNCTSAVENSSSPLSNGISQASAVTIIKPRPAIAGPLAAITANGLTAAPRALRRAALAL
jgi:hypothetical protein